jgi:hypothetical protein
MDKQRSDGSTVLGATYSRVSQRIGDDTIKGNFSPSVYGLRIAQTALRNIGVSIKDNSATPEYAAAVSIIFTKSTNQSILPGTPPENVLSTSILCSSLLHDKRFEQIPVSGTSPGDIVIASRGNQANGFAGIVIDHGRLISDSPRGVQNASSLAEIQHTNPGLVIFRYVGVPGHRSDALANANFDPSEARLPAGQPGGGQWTAGGAGGPRNGKIQSLGMAPSATVVSGESGQLSAQKRPAPQFDAPDSPLRDVTAQYFTDVGEIWKGYGDAISETALGLWKAATDPIGTTEGLIKGIGQFANDPVGVLKAIIKQVADTFTSGDQRKAGKLVGLVLINLAGAEASESTISSLLSKIKAIAAGETVTLTKAETEIVQRVMSGKELRATEETGLMRGGRTDSPHYVTDAASNEALRARQRLSLQKKPEYKVTLKVPEGEFSPPTRVEPKYGMPGGGTERVGEGRIPVQIVKVKQYK